MIEQITIGLSYSTQGTLEYLNQKLAEGFEVIGHSSYAYDGEISETFTIYKRDSVGPAVETNSLVLTSIATIQRDQTKNNQRPMWRCKTHTGEKVNIFLNVDEPAKDSFHLFEQAGWADLLNDLGLYTEIDTRIYVAIRKDGQWWEIVKVAPKLEEDNHDGFDPEIYGNKDISDDLGLEGENG